ncbi:MAG: tetratricopeptide repeat protein, partial [bacterium]
IEACETVIKLRPKDPSVHMALGEAWAAKGDKNRARESWKKILDIDPSNRGHYSLVGYELSKFGLDEDAIEVYESGEKAVGQHVFARELSRAYEKIGDYEKAIDQILNVLLIKPGDLVRVERELKRLMPPGVRNAVGRSTVLRAVRSRARREPGWPLIHRILGDLYLLEGDYAEALKEYGKSGAEEPLWELAQKAEREGLHDAALTSYERLAESKGRYSRMAALRMGGVLEATESYREALGAYKKFMHDFPGDPQVSLAEFRIGIVRLNGFSDPGGALPYFKGLADTRARQGVGLDSRFMVADCNLRLGNLAKAADELEQITESVPSGRAFFLLAETMYYQGDFDSALTVYKRVVDQFPNSDYVNDALSRSVFIGDNVNDRKLLHRIANAERLSYSRQYDSAIRELKLLLKDEPVSAPLDRCMLLLAEALEGNKSYNEALAAYRDLINLYPESRLRPEAQRRIGELFAERLNDRKAAIKELEEVLLQFPDYVLASAVRNRIEQLKEADQP